MTATNTQPDNGPSSGHCDYCAVLPLPEVCRRRFPKDVTDNFSLVSRHGARLDAADPEWHLTSPTPYDPPLTYGGWRQSQALGARIASIVQVRESAAADDQTNGHDKIHPSKHGRRKYKVVLHTSPFLRCIQTSIAIIAGLKQHEAATNAAASTPHHGPHIFHSGDPHTHASHLAAIPEPETEYARQRRAVSPKPTADSKVLLRVDAFLGEWLSPDYFTDITAPPCSQMMVASAKGELLRRGDAIVAIKLPNSPDSEEEGSPLQQTSSLDAIDHSSLDMTDLKQSLPPLARAHSHHAGSIPKSEGSTISNKSGLDTGDSGIGYEPPVPAYAISPSQPIPQGYVAHARDACVKVDYSWDSQRPPLDWGNGGEYGEEWSNMHKRFRRGFMQMLSWYRSHSVQKKMDEPESETSSRQSNGESQAEDIEEDDTETVLVLVTHGAGCNALIGALTNHPVLIDVGMASLTMAVRKNTIPRRPSESDHPYSTTSRRKRSSMDTSSVEDYDVKLTASTEHLRSNSKFLNPRQLTRSPSLPMREKSPYRYERHVIPPHSHRHSSNSPQRDYFSRNSGSSSRSPGGTPKSPGNQSPMRRSATVHASSSSSHGLWSMPLPKAVEALKDSELAVTDDPPLESTSSPVQSPHGSEFKNSLHKLKTVRFSADESVNGDNESPTANLPSPSGLWGPPRPKLLASEREKASKRRWTLSEA